MKKFYIQWHITDRCNLRCIDCYQEKFTKEGELEWEDLRLICDNLIDTMKKWNSKLVIILTGGEPLLKQELWDIFECLNKSDYVSELGLITNGTIVDRYISEIKRFNKIKKVNVSLDGVTKEINDSIRGEGTFEKTIENIFLLRDSGIPVVIMFTLMKRNLKEASNLFDFVKENFLNGFIIERFIPLGQGKKLVNEVISGKELDLLYRDIFKQCEADYIPEKIIKYRALHVSFDSKEPELFGGECIVGRDGMAILPDGTVLPCRRFFLPIGNLLESSLNGIWKNSEVLNNLRNKKNLKDKCGICEISDCIGCRAMTHSLTGDYLAEDPHCWIY
ncbi:MAG: radical SAM protein [Endomicrobiia bacterium]